MKKYINSEFQDYLKDYLLQHKSNHNFKYFNTTKIYGIALTLASQNAAFQSLDEKLIYYMVNNVLSQLYKEEEIFRLKKGVYTFSNDLVDKKIALDEQGESFQMIYDIARDHLKETANAVPVDRKIFIKQSLIDDLSEQEKKYFLNLFKQYHMIDDRLTIDNQRELYMFKIIQMSLERYTYDYIDNFSKAKAKDLNISWEDFKKYSEANEQYLYKNELSKKRAMNRIKKLYV